MAIINNNVQNVKFLRNGSVFNPSGDKTAREVALETMNGQLNILADGTAILGRYQESNGIVKTLVGFAYVNGETRTLTVFDVDGAGADVDAKIKAAIEALDAEETSTDGKNVQVKVTEVDGKITAVNITTDNTVNSGDVDTAITNAINELDGSVIAENGYFVKSVTEADGKISGTTEALPTVAAISEAGKPITAVSESLGAISAATGTIDAQYVNINDAGGIITATNVEGALAEIAAEIDAMDKDASAEDGKVVTTVSEADGIVSETKANVKDLQLGGYAKTNDTGDILSADTINVALSKLENKAAAITIENADGSINVTTASTGTDINVNIKSGEKVLAKTGNAGLYTDIKLSAVTPSSTAVKEEYSLVGTDGSVLGTNIKIYKDSHIVSITYITDSSDPHYQNLQYVYIDASGATQTEYVDISSLVLEAEFASGITVTNHVAHGVVDPDSEKDESNASFLTVGADGFKVSGIKDAIDTKINKLDADLSGNTTHVTVGVAEVDGKITAVTVAESDIASAQGLADEITARTAADTELSNRLGTGVTTANSATAQLAALSGTSESLSGDTSVEGAKRYADAKLAEAVAGLDATVSGETGDGKVNVKVTEADGVITAVEVVGTDIASASALTAEIAARKAVDGVNGDAYTADTTANYISGASSLYGADQALDTALKALSDVTVNEVQVNGVALAETNNAVNVQISSDAGTGAASTPITVATDNSTGAITLKLEGLDCGTY